MKKVCAFHNLHRNFFPIIAFFLQGREDRGEKRERTKVWGLFALLLACGLSAQAIPLGLESGPHYFRTYPPALSAFIQLTNQALLYGNQTFSGDIPLLPLLSGGVGVRAAETLGEPFAVGLGFSLVRMGTGTEGAWGAQEVSVSLDLSYVDVHVLFTFALLPGVLTCGVAGGLGWTSLAYAVTFPALDLSFVPAPGEETYSSRTFSALFFLRAAWPLFSSLTVGVEAGFRWAVFPALLSTAGIPLDLDRDGNPDPLDLSGVWLGLTLRVEFPL